jgi:hypothetical protein
VNEWDYASPEDAETETESSSDQFGVVRIEVKGGAIAIVDSFNVDKIPLTGWWLDEWGYPTHNSKTATRRNKNIRMHTYLLRAPVGMVVDHINRNPLDNRMENLRVADYAQNGMNKTSKGSAGTPWKGISYEPRRSPSKPYRATIAARGNRYKLGRYSTPEEAARAYDDAARELHGEFACLNFP